MFQFGDLQGWLGIFLTGLNAVKTRLGVITRPTPVEVDNGTANTALIFHTKRLLALHEGDLPYAVLACAWWSATELAHPWQLVMHRCMWVMVEYCAHK